MNKAPLILSVIALMISVLLLVNNFTGDKAPKSTSNSGNNTEVSQELTGDIAYVHIDSIVDSYDYYNMMKTALMKKQEEEGGKIESRYRTLQRKAMEMQKQVDSRMMTPTTAQKKQQELMAAEQQIMVDKQNMEMQLGEESQNLTLQVFDSIKVMLEEVNKEHHYKMILSSTKVGGTVLIGDANLDITSKVLAGMNKRYKASLGTTETVEETK